MKKIIKEKINNFEKGFTLVEVLIATAILSIAISGVVTVAVKGGLNANDAQFRLTASYLAEEGLDLVRAKRDSYVISSTTTYSDGWNAFLTAAESSTGCATVCDIDISDTSSYLPFVVSPGKLTYSLSSSSAYVRGYYSHIISGTQTIYTRRITINPSSDSTRAEIDSTVSWPEGSVTFNVSAKETLYNWY